MGQQEVFPQHLFSISSLDLTDVVKSRELSGDWFALGIWSKGHHRNDDNVEDVVERQTLLIGVEDFGLVFPELRSIGNTLRGLGRANGCVRGETYQYEPFHVYYLGNSRCEPLCFVSSVPGPLFLNPDPILYFELRKKSHDESWWDQRREMEVVRHRFSNVDQRHFLEFRTNYLERYLRQRQRCLLVGHYQHRCLYSPNDDEIKRFKEGDLLFGSPEENYRAFFQNWGNQRWELTGERFLERRLHFWFQVPPPPLDPNDPWYEEPSFDPTRFTLPTRHGEVCPARWASHQLRFEESRDFAGGSCDFMTRVYFRQEVLQKYESTAGYEVRDDGSVRRASYWGLERSTHRIGNALLSTAIGDFAEHMPLEEWPHWKEYAVPPPGQEAVKAFREEVPIPEAVNNLVSSLGGLNHAFRQWAMDIHANVRSKLWQEKSETAHKLKRTYSDSARDEEFLHRAVLISTLVIEGLQVEPMRRILLGYGKRLHKKNPCGSKGGGDLGSRKLLERVLLVAEIERSLAIASEDNLGVLVSVAEGGKTGNLDPELAQEVGKIHKRVRHELRALAFLYDLRTHGGIAHTASPAKTANAAKELGLGPSNWTRRSYLRLLEVITTSIQWACWSIRQRWGVE